MIGTFPILTMIIDKFVTNSRTWQGSLSLTILLVLHILKTLTWQGSLSTTMPSCSARLYTFIRYSTPSLSSENHYCDYWLSNTKIYYHDDDLSKASKHHPVLLAILTVVYLAMLIYLKKKTWKASGIVNLMFSSSWSRSSTRYSRHRSFSFLILNLYFFTPLLWGHLSIA